MKQLNNWLLLAMYRMLYTQPRIIRVKIDIRVRKIAEIQNADV